MNDKNMRLETALAVADQNWALAYQDPDLATGSHQEILERALEVLATRVRVALGVLDDDCHPTGMPRPEVGPFTHTVKPSLDGPWMTMIDLDEEEPSNVIPFRHPGQREPGWR